MSQIKVDAVAELIHPGKYRVSCWRHRDTVVRVVYEITALSEQEAAFEGIRRYREALEAAQ